MRGRLLVKGAIVREIRPLDVKRAIDFLLFNFKDQEVITNDQWSAALISDSDLIEGKMTDEVNAAFFFINDSYLAKRPAWDTEDEADPSFDKEQLIELLNNLNNECAVLISHNHQNCWGYGWSFFRFVQDLYAEK